MHEIQPETMSYQIECLLGEGLNSRVYKAIRCNPKGKWSQVVALKILKSKNLVEIWRNEFIALSKVRSTHCVSVLSWETIEGSPALVLEYIEGATLFELQAHCQLTAVEVEELCRQIYCGLSDLNKFYLSHGDLNLNNIIIDQKGQVKLIDFGIASCQKGVRYITPQFAAPEVVSGDPPDYYSDLYSLGLLEKHLLRQPEFKHQGLLTKNKQLRDCRSWPVNSCAADSLAKKVNSYLFEKTSQQASTLMLKAPAAPKHWFHLRWLVSVLFILGLLFGQLDISADRQWPTQVRLSFFTHRWIRVKIDHRDLGYSPIKPILLTPGQYQVQWQHIGGHYSRTLTVRSGEPIILGEDFFFGE